MVYLIYLQKYWNVHKMPWQGHLQGHSEISDSVLYYPGDIFTFILLGYQSGEIQVGRESTEKQVGTKCVRR